jgi:hypothetical protein
VFCEEAFEDRIMALPVLQTAYQIVVTVTTVLAEIDMNVKSATFLAERLTLLQPGIRKLIESHPDDAILPMAIGLCECCQESSDFIGQFTRKGKNWVLDKARKAYNRAGDKETIEGLLVRINQFSVDLNLGLAVDIKALLAKMLALFQEDAQELQETLGQMQREAAERGDEQEKQHGEIFSALQEIRIALAADRGSVAVDGDSCALLPALDDSYKMVNVVGGGNCSSDDDDAAFLGEGAFGEVYKMCGKVDGRFYAIKFIKVGQCSSLLGWKGQ